MYLPGERVWARVSEEEAWWPSIVIIPETVRELDPRPDEFDTTVKFYGDGQYGHFDSTQTKLIVPFDKNSQKHQTSDPILRAAIQEAMEDDAALPIQAAAAAKASDVGGKRERDHKKGTSKRHKKEETAMLPPDPVKRGHKKTSMAVEKIPSESALKEAEVAAVEVDDSKLIEYRSSLDDAISQDNIVKARKVLLELLDVQVSYRQLQATLIGRSVAKVTTTNSMAALHETAKCIVQFWIHQLPAATLNAIRELQRVEQGPDESQKKGFVDVVVECFEPDEELNAQLDEIAPVARNFAEALTTREDRQHFIETVRKEGHTDLRRKILSGEITPAMFLKMTATDLETDVERRERTEALEEKIRAKEEAAAKDVVPTDMFTCPECGKSSCTFREQQTRSADEPTTKYIHCVECKHNWIISE